ncbi:DUF3934 family protein [Paenibacillus pini]|uniref:DUF3934 domain-containing protein n=1 Tax=Paenibacillus pini JCM 16418 TaxID=1236976 RepID=W7YMM6_9BACL|nr:DUF3934 family protein [Paenibacillus pini]GAF08883.1 hypothetical protein JCM16418_2993 [Paenibacillus pini JCM 16418]
MSKAKGKGGTGRGTDSKGWTRWNASAKKAKNTPKPYTSKNAKEAGGTKNASSNKGTKS